MPPEPSVTSACEGPRSCSLMYASALLPKSFERPGPKSVSPATYCSGVEVVVWWRWIVDMRAPFLSGVTLGCVTGENKVAIFGGFVAGKAGFVEGLVGRFAVVELSETPATSRVGLDGRESRPSRLTPRRAAGRRRCRTLLR